MGLVISQEETLQATEAMNLWDEDFHTEVILKHFKTLQTDTENDKSPFEQYIDFCRKHIEEMKNLEKAKKIDEQAIK